MPDFFMKPLPDVLSFSRKVACFLILACVRVYRIHFDLRFQPLMLLVGIVSFGIQIDYFLRVLTVSFFLITTLKFELRFCSLGRLELLLGLRILVCYLIRQARTINLSSLV